MLRVSFIPFICLVFVSCEACDTNVSPKVPKPTACGCDSQLYDMNLEFQLKLDGIKQELQKMSIEFAQCPTGFFYVPEAGSCYKVMYEAVTEWTTAQQKCQQLDDRAHLVAITTKNESDALKKHLHADITAHPSSCNCINPGVNAGSVLWTSLQRSTNDSCQTPFVWKISACTQLSMDFTDWSGYPSCTGNREFCVQLTENANFTWNDVPCTNFVGCPFCEIDIAQH